MTTWKSIVKKLRSKGTQIGCGFVCTALLYFAYVIHFPGVGSVIHQLDDFIYDQLVQFNLRPHQQNPHVIVIDIDNKSVQKEGRWPWPRNKMAELITKLKQNGVVTIGTDMVMAESEINYALGLKKEIQSLKIPLTSTQHQLPVLLDEIAPQVDNDQFFARALQDHNVVLGYLFQDEKDIKKGVLPPPLISPEGTILERHDLNLYQFLGYNGCLDLFLHASTQAGAVTNLPDFDGSVRHGLMIASYNNQLYATLPLAIAMNYLMIDHAILHLHNNKLRGIQIGSVNIPTNSSGQILIPYWGQPGTLTYYSATDIIQGNFTPNSLQGSIAIIGSTMILLADLHLSPVSPSFPGVEMVGNMVEGIISQQLVTPYEWHTRHGRFVILLLGIAITLLFSFLEVASMFILAPLIILVTLAASLYLFVAKSFYIPSALLLILISLQTLFHYGYLFIMERKQKRKINQLFGQYVPQEYVKEIIEFPDQYSMEGQERTMTVQFSDIRDFTTISESLGASDVKRMLNTFFTPITEIIFSFRGTIDKYVGDMIVAFWGAPLHDEDHVDHAIGASLKIIEQLPQINVKMMEHNLPVVTIGIGLATGLMNVGDMGSEFRRAYTVIGDTVNLASRLQDLTKFYHVNILVSDKTRLGQEQFVWRTIDKITVKGRKTGLCIYQPLGRVSEVSAEVITELAEYHDALNDYYLCNWSQAEKKFGMLKSRSPDIYIYHMYLERITEFKKSPVVENWDGIYVHLHK